MVHLLVALVLVAAADPVVSAVPHVRPVSAGASVLLTEAVARSAVVNQLLNQLAQTDVFVYVELTSAADIRIARTKLVAAPPGARFLRIALNAHVAPWDRVAYLAHELQHAVEIATAADVRDDDGVRRLYARVGFVTGPNQYETAAARDVERRVRVELAHNRRPELHSAAEDPSALVRFTSR
jgi:hypothetical protein